MSSAWPSAWLITGAHGAAQNEGRKERSVKSGWALAETAPCMLSSLKAGESPGLNNDQPLSPGMMGNFREQMGKHCWWSPAGARHHSKHPARMNS